MICEEAHWQALWIRIKKQWAICPIPWLSLPVWGKWWAMSPNSQPNGDEHWEKDPGYALLRVCRCFCLNHDLPWDGVFLWIIGFTFLKILIMGIILRSRLHGFWDQHSLINGKDLCVLEQNLCICWGWALWTKWLEIWGLHRGQLWLPKPHRQTTPTWMPLDQRGMRCSNSTRTGTVGFLPRAVLSSIRGRDTTVLLSAGSQ